MAEQQVTVLVCDMYHKADRKHAAKASHTMYVSAGAGKSVRRLDLCTSHFEQVYRSGVSVSELSFVNVHAKGRAEPEPKRKPGGQVGQSHTPKETYLTCEVCGMSGLNTFAMGQHMRHHRE